MGKIYDVVAVGLQVIDLVVYKVDEDILHRDITTVDSVKMLLGGDACNEALTLAAIGAKVGIIGVVGNDGLGDYLIHTLQSSGVDVFDQREAVNTAISIVMVKEGGDRHFVFQPTSNELLSYHHINEDVIRSAKVMTIAGSLGLKKLDGADANRLLELARDHGTISVIDFKITGSHYDMEMVRRQIALSDYICPSLLEASFLTGESEPVKMAHVLRKFGAENVVIKLGGDGCLISAGMTEKHIPACPCSVVDTTGAGDTFTGSFAYAVSQGWDIEKAARFANAAGSLAVEHMGANGGIRDIDQIFERMECERLNA